MFLALLQTMRPKQWAKNGFLFAALIFDGQLFYPPAVLRTLAGFVLFSLLSSVVYILNDLTDLEADRQHPIKRLRPLPSGRLRVGVARVAAVVILLVVLPLAYLLSVPFAVIAVVELVSDRSALAPPRYGAMSLDAGTSGLWWEYEKTRTTPEPWRRGRCQAVTFSRELKAE